MEQETYDKLKEISTQNPHAAKADRLGPSVFVLLELFPVKDNLAMLSTVVDPDLKDQGDAREYLKLSPAQRTALETAEVMSVVLPGIATVATQAPVDEDAWKFANNDIDTLARIIRVGCFKAAALKIVEHGQEHFPDTPTGVST